MGAELVDSHGHVGEVRSPERVGHLVAARSQHRSEFPDGHGPKRNEVLVRHHRAGMHECPTVTTAPAPTCAICKTVAAVAGNHLAVHS